MLPRPRPSVVTRRLFPVVTRRVTQPPIHIRPALAYSYSSLRRPRQQGPRGRILNHVDQLRPATQRPTEVITEQSDMPFAQDPVHTPVEIPTQPGAVITPDYHGAPVLSQSALVVGREFEMLNIFLGYEQANRYKIMDPNGTYLGYILEEEGFAKSVGRQFLGTHRRMNATILNVQGEVVFKIVRPFSFINSRIYIYTADDRLVGEVQQRWHLLRRRYDLFVGNTQFSYIDTPFLGWDFNLQDAEGQPLGNVSRNFMGFAREIFTDTGNYVLRMDAVENNARGMTLDERAVTLACAVSIDFDYFSRHSHAGSGGIMPFPFFGFGGSGEQPADQGGDNTPSSTPPPPNDSSYPPPPQQQVPPSQYGQGEDGWLTDEEAGVSSPADTDIWSAFFGDDE
ncbi:hypothetical protein O0I10_010081 [Lichtheimia ornata]|uniref:Phospholipid scramblase n=1 Tax=Lichtheimia ornata TaxID=688661 RepID=A0AAD7XRN0_9FUNG|nr:uncharacterized protein O0I10_010081 [Lichtheimia ornata]KAJ8654259.1 hypothetical protein O0I10_010081 [Lichtheimia ornata]